MPQTIQGDDSYPSYRRRDDGRQVSKSVRGSSINVDNKWIVPYNPYLIKKYDCHVNVEICSSVKAVKYLYKYITKGHDRISVQVQDPNVANTNVDEIKEYLDCRYVSAMEACWRIFEFPMHRQSHVITVLPVHLPNQQSVVFNENNPEEVNFFAYK